MSLLPDTVCPICEALEVRLERAASVLDITIGSGAPNTVGFADVDGSAVTVSIRRGTAVVSVAGDELSMSTQAGTTFVTGSNIALLGLKATGTTSRTRIAVSVVGGDGHTILGTVTADGSLARIDAPNVVLTGRLDTVGVVRRVTLERAENAVLSIGGGMGTSSLAISEATNAVVVSAVPLRRVSVGTFGGEDAGSTLNAPSVGRLVVTGRFRGSVTATSAGALDLGTVEGATINVADAVRRLQAGSVTDAEVNVGHSIGIVSFREMQRSRILVGVRPLSPDERAPATLSDFVFPSVIRSARIAFSDLTSRSVIAAHSIAKTSLGLVSAFGAPSQLVVAADLLGRTTARVYQLAGKGATTTRLGTLEAEVQHIGSVELRAL
jgi:hypothetical protein